MTTSKEQELRELLQSLKSSKYEAWQRIPELFKSLRNDHGLTQQQVADRVGITHNAICMVEAGKPAVSIDTMEAMIEAVTNANP